MDAGEPGGPPPLAAVAQWRTVPQPANTAPDYRYRSFQVSVSSVPLELLSCMRPRVFNTD